MMFLWFSVSNVAATSWRVKKVICTFRLDIQSHVGWPTGRSVNWLSCITAYRRCDYRRHHWRSWFYALCELINVVSSPSHQSHFSYECSLPLNSHEASILWLSHMLWFMVYKRHWRIRSIFSLSSSLVVSIEKLTKLSRVCVLCVLKVDRAILPHSPAQEWKKIRNSDQTSWKKWDSCNLFCCLCYFHVALLW